MVDFPKIPQSLYSWIPEEDPFKTTKKCQIKYWWDAFSDLFDKHSLKYLDSFVEVLSSEDCWKNVYNLHGVKLDRQAVGRKLITLPFRFNFLTKFKIACRCCLEEEIMLLNKRRKMPIANLYSLLKAEKKGETSPKYSLSSFWLCVLEGHIKSMEFQESHPFEYGFQCAMHERQLQAVEFFWNKINSLPEYELSEVDKDHILLKFVTVEEKEYHESPEIFDFLFSQIRPIAYSELLRVDYKYHTHYSVLSTLLDALRFDKFKKFFDRLQSHQVTEITYCHWLQLLVREDITDQYLNVATSAFIHIWQKKGFHKHRSFVLNQLIESEVFQEHLLLPLINKGYTDPLWAILDNASPEEVNKYMESDNAKKVSDILEEKNERYYLKKFSSYKIKDEVKNKSDTNRTR